MKQNVYLPNYKDGSIVNLMSSIGKAFKLKTKYKELKLLDSKDIKKYKNIILIVIDGLGYEYLMKKDESFLKNNLKGSMTSIFLPTTVCAVTSFLTGVAPQQHAYTGWFMYLKEIGIVSKILPFTPRIGNEVFSEQGVKVSDVLSSKGIFSKIKAKSYYINPEEIVDSDFSRFLSKNAKRIGCRNLNSFFEKIKKAVDSKGKKYIHAYWNKFDSVAHKKGVNSKEAGNYFKKLDKGIKSLVKSINKTNTLLMVTSDHGFIDTPLNKIIWIEKHPKLEECLSLPLCGEGRVAYCYIKPSKTKDFEKYVKIKLKKYCWMYKSKDLIKRNYFGLFKPNPKLFNRVGDYVLICKENYIIKDKLVGEKKTKHIGHHGGVSKNEMLIPLVVVDV